MTPEAKKEMLTLICDDSVLQSLLYDLDLLPEQLEEGSQNWTRMCVICAHWKMRVTMKVP